MTQPHDVLYASQHYQGWLAALKERAMLQTHNQAQAMFRAVLLELRRHMSMDQVLTFANALPPLPRGIFLEGWRPADPQRATTAGAFLARVVENLAPHQIPPDSIVADVFAVLAERSEPAAAKAMREQLPDQLAVLWP